MKNLRAARDSLESMLTYSQKVKSSLQGEIDLSEALDNLQIASEWLEEAKRHLQNYQERSEKDRIQLRS